MGWTPGEEPRALGAEERAELRAWIFLRLDGGLLRDAAFAQRRAVFLPAGAQDAIEVDPARADLPATRRKKMARDRKKILRRPACCHAAGKDGTRSEKDPTQAGLTATRREKMARDRKKILRRPA
jgi:hypothetical protein